jgi:hypothetical protein
MDRSRYVSHSIQRLFERNLVSALKEIVRNGIPSPNARIVHLKEDLYQKGVRNVLNFHSGD